MYYQLLCIKAADKAYVTHTSDSLILRMWITTPVIPLLAI